MVREYILNESDTLTTTCTTKSNNNNNTNNYTVNINAISAANKHLLATSSSSSTCTNNITLSNETAYEDVCDFTLLNLVIKNMINDPDQGIYSILF